MRRPAVCFAALVVAGLLGGCKGDRVKCEQACRNFATLTFWAKADAEIAKLPPGEQRLRRQKKLSDFTNYVEDGVETCITQCQSANNDDQVDCMIAAKTAADSETCVKD